MSERAIELLALPTNDSLMVLDLGCGSGISGEVLSDQGHFWVGVDISEPMLNVAANANLDGDLMQWDLGQGLSFRVGVFDAAISISAIQWLCNADKKSHVPQKRLLDFFSGLYRALKKGARAVFQFYPENSQQMELITNAAMRAGFGGGMVVDFPNSTRAKKYFLVLFAGEPNYTMPAAKTDESEIEQQVKNVSARRNHDKRGKTPRAPLKHSKEWILNKKERQRRQGKDVRPDSKFTGRKRRGKFT
jgi:18S rRNA (guanine1575-N7)-methyltransferase